MKIELSILILLISFNLFGQNELRKIKLNEDISWNTHTQEEQNQYYFGLTPIKKSKNEFHLRYQKVGQIVDLVSENGRDFKGTIINEITEYKKGKSELGRDLIENNYVYEVKELNPKLSNEVGRYILQEKSYMIPTDSLIDNWNFRWLHCGVIKLNYKIRNKTYSSFYTCHSNQEDSIKYISQIKYINKKIIDQFELKKSYSDFFKKLETGKYYSDDRYGIQYVKTEKQKERWANDKPRRDYLKSISDTITIYLQNQLNIQISKSSQFRCFNDYYVFFSKKGKFKKLRIAGKLKERIFDKDFQRCKRVLKKALKQIRIDFVDSKYQFYRKVRFSFMEEKDKIYVRDSTRY